MNVLFDHANPFLLAHGGFQIQIEETKRALETLGVAVEYLRWWDDQQTGDIIHFFGVAPANYIEQAHRKSARIVQTPLFTETCNRSDIRLRTQGAMVRSLLALPIAVAIKGQLNWRSFQLADMNVVGLEAERKVLEWVYDVPSNHVSVLSLGLRQEFLDAKSEASRGDALICVGTITERKDTVLLARIAREAQVPILFVGKPYDVSDPYWTEFVALIDNRWVRYHSHTENYAELIKLYHTARAFVIMSRYENWCLAAHEAAACGLPVLLPKQKWSLERFGNEASYFSDKGIAANMSELKAFYDRAPAAPAPRVTLCSWREVAQRLKVIYEALLSSSR